MRKSAVAFLMTAALAVLGCQTITEDLPESQQTGGNNPAVANPIPVVVVPIPLPTAVVPTPPPANNPNPQPNNPNPAPTNQPSNPNNGGGDIPTNTNPVAKLTAKLYFVENFGRQVPYPPPACVGCRIHLDVTPTDSRNQHTQARGTPRWTYTNTRIVNITGNSPYNPVLEARDTGDLEAYAEVDGVKSNTVHISIR